MTLALTIAALLFFATTPAFVAMLWAGLGIFMALLVTGAVALVCLASGRGRA